MFNIMQDLTIITTTKKRYVRLQCNFFNMIQYGKLYGQCN